MSSPAVTPPKRTPRKAAPRGKWSEEQLLTSDKSVLIDADLVKLLARPEAWNILEEDEKREILALLPADTHSESELPPDDPNAKIPPLPDSFVRYSNNWRDGIRQFQLDLQNGRYDPEWLRQAENARRQRENGDFDSFKEREFEQFWGQKQKTSMTLISGESAKIKLTQLIRTGVFLVGDVWRFGYVYGKGPDRIIIDKEVRIHEINGSKMTFVIPAGQRVFLVNHSHLEQDLIEEPGTKESPAEKVVPVKEELQATDEVRGPEAPKEGSKDDGPSEELVDTGRLEVATKAEGEGYYGNDSVQVVIVSPRHPDSTGKASKRPTPLPAIEPPAKRKRGRPRKIPAPAPAPAPALESEPDPEPEPEEQNHVGSDTALASMGTLSVEITKPAPSPAAELLPATNNVAMDATPSPNEAEPDQGDPSSSPLSEPPTSLTTSPPKAQPTADEPDEIIVPDISSPMVLVHKILQIDGRRPDGRTSNSWKEIRCYRKNQDMGSLWDVRQTWFSKQN
ncbi:uncharacterized protein N7482_005205 [Penicillium canariense]|uniref:DEUBAD domain-containing protein n=1 Tax=Penicillium canariense TaxID=189055 RepID=A0A9W9I1Y8_9EURO|nr:uncharacterized protein N7482_005205 [Penicillium canariense]KAJ5166424.1 hypothetical protein N7482_005205 [Penicillium canariense]